MTTIKYNLFLHIIQNKTEQFIKLFQNECIDPQIQLNAFEWTPLHCAAYQGNMSLIEYLISQGADVSTKCKNGMTALDMAIQKGHKHLKELLTPQQLDDILSCNQRYDDKIS
ncbi:Ankyrin repeat-containing domain [Pseudocohnilembus persalinus]|uniref:Ankyrin repeat-containing domain n=1 Tax=Pseudocohnilembus persalinus TaxID=266149 RepID=A0A0V0R5Z0_PSEPJ|nr:Ankyrin repeat-containing domain [Pseudocohnilembus persalinus]|eukprot:KRX09924.1 Ankyrin repeat-containing domain [Pseudocohnilembus persalinus]